MKMEETITIWERCKEGTLGFALFKTYKRHMDKTLEKDRKCVTKICEVGCTDAGKRNVWKGDRFSTNRRAAAGPS